MQNSGQIRHANEFRTTRLWPASSAATVFTEGAPYAQNRWNQRLLLRCVGCAERIFAGNFCSRGVPKSRRPFQVSQCRSEQRVRVLVSHNDPAVSRYKFCKTCGLVLKVLRSAGPRISRTSRDHWSRRPCETTGLADFLCETPGLAGVARLAGLADLARPLVSQILLGR